MRHAYAPFSPVLARGEGHAAMQWERIGRPGVGCAGNAGRGPREAMKASPGDLFRQP